MPRRHAAWSEFTVVTEGTYPDVTCNHCGIPLRKCQPSRHLLGHLKNCPRLSEAEQKKWMRFGEPTAKPKRKRQKRKKTSNPRSPPATQESVFTEESLAQSQPTTPLALSIAKDLFQAEVARGFYAGGLPFRCIEVSRVRKAFTVLNPDMEKYLPNRKALAGRLLTQEYKREQAELIARLRDEPTLALISDGWTSIKKEKVINYVVASPTMRPLLWCTRLTGEEEQTSQYVAKEIGVVIDEINKDVGQDVVASVTTDNAPVMQKAWKILEEKRSISCNGCSSHALNLVLEEVLTLPWMKSTLDRSVTLSKFIRNRSQLLARFRKLQNEGGDEHQRALRLPVPTRWYSSVECIKSVLDNRRTIGKLFKQKKFMKRFGRRRSKLQQARTIVRDKSFWNRLKLVKSLLEPIVNAVAMLETDTCCISMVYWQFSQLCRNSKYIERMPGVPATIQLQILASIKSKWDFVHTDTMGIAFLLDQTKFVSDFVDDDLTTSIEYIKTVATRMRLVSTPAEQRQITEEATDFYIKKNRWSTERRELEGALSPMAWWMDKLAKRADHTYYYPLLSQLAVKIYSIPTSSAASERSWSIHDFILTKRRNRLDSRRVEMLVFIYCNAGDKDSKTKIVYKLGDESEDEDDNIVEDIADSAAIDAAEQESSGSSDSNNCSVVADFSLSYEGSEEQKFEC